jgi:hypothetical protein
MKNHHAALPSIPLEIQPRLGLTKLNASDGKKPIVVSCAPPY